jgi:UDP-N-acetylmuramate: L-alanyl-gamma-D-glutamyl-meso-diaminopimelate ligase
MGIGGVGMGNLAGMLVSIGKQVRGSDKGVYSPMKEYLEGLNIDFKIGFRAENLIPAPELIVVGNVVTRDNPEAQEMLRRNIPYISMPEAIKEFFLRGKEVIVVAGTHGKTTTTALLGWILNVAGRDPSVLLGGISRDFNAGFYLGRGKYFVIEGDEYDTAFFDKSPKFLHYEPRNLILTTVEFDHGDIYKDLEDVKRSFRKLVEALPSDGFIVYGSYSNAVADLLKGIGVKSVSAGEGGFWDYKNLEIKEGYTEFVVMKDNKHYGKFRWKKSGLHNVRNCLMAIALSEHVGLNIKDIQAGVESFKGVKRRQEEIGEFRGVLLIDDFAHHPTEVKETISAIKLRYPERRLWAVFEPRSNTTRRNFFQELYPDSFMQADLVIISDVFNKHTLDEGIRLNPEQIVLDLKQRGKDAFYIESVEEIVKFLESNVKTGDVILIMSNGSFGGIVENLKNALNRNSS